MEIAPAPFRRVRPRLLHGLGPTGDQCLVDQSIARRCRILAEALVRIGEDVQHLEQIDGLDEIACRWRDDQFAESR